MPGYTGHIHASKHIYGKSYGHASRQLVTEAERESGESAAPAFSALSASGNLRVSGRLSGYAEHNPQGTRGRDDANRRAHIPGYTGHVPVKDVEIHGVSFGRHRACSASRARHQSRRGGRGAAAALGESRPAGAPARYAQPADAHDAWEARGVRRAAAAYRLSKGAVDVSAFKEKGEDNKWRAARGEDVQEVIARRAPRVPARTLYTPGRNHVFGESSAKMTRRRRGGHRPTPPASSGGGANYGTRERCGEQQRRRVLDVTPERAFEG